MTGAEASDERPPVAPIGRTVRRLLSAIPGRRDDAVAIVNGLFGDTLDERASRLATPTTIRVGNTVLPLDRDTLPAALAEAGTDVSGRICVLVHGLMSTESIWRFPSDASTSYGSLLTEEYDVTTLSLRYNTGRPISANGRDLARLLDELVLVWPIRVREINLIGHSMGGLVVRSACHYGRSRRTLGHWLRYGRRWTGKVRRIVLIGVPNTGAGLEAFVHSASTALGSLPVPGTRLVGRGLDRRSAGIKGLRRGTILDDEVREHDLAVHRRRHPHRPLRRADYLVIAGSVSSDPNHPFGRVLGDALVTSSSATGRADDRELFPGATVRMFPKVTHNALARHPDVYEAIADWW